MGAKVILILLLHTQYSHSTPPRNYEFGLNVKDASYYIKTYDFPQSPRLYREYSSARLRNSLFGYSWCSFLDVKVDLKNKPRFYDCRTGFTSDKVTKKQSKYYVKDMIFNKHGQLESIVSDKHQYKIIYIEKTPRRVLKDEDSYFKIIINPKTGYIEKTIQNSSNHIRHYHYENHLLTWVRSSETGTVTYKYNEMFNLVNFRTSNGYKEAIRYSDKLDHAISRSWDQCLTTIKYKEEKDLIRLAHIQRKCGKTKPVNSVYKFKYEDANLLSLEVRMPTSSMKIDYDSKTKQILKMRRNHGSAHTIHTGER